MPKSKAKGKSNGAKQQAAKHNQKKNSNVKKAPASPTLIGKALRYAGSTLGGFVGGPAGSTIGHSAAAWFSKIMGQGEYHINSNTLLTQNQAPTFRTESDGIRINHSEMFLNLSGTTAFTNTSFLLNPGNRFLFPWLSTLCNSFETFTLEGMIITFKSMSANALNSTNTALGTVVMATSYDALDADFASKQQADSYEYATSCRPADNMTHPIECAPDRNVLKQLYLTSVTTTSGLPATSDARMYFPGKVQVMTEGMQAAAVIGELWVSYDIRLHRPRLPNPVGATSVSSHFTGLMDTANNHTTVVVGANSNAPCFINPGTRNVLFTAPGRYLVSQSVIAPTGSVGSVLTAGISNGSIDGLFPNGTWVLGTTGTYYSSYVINSTSTGPALPCVLSIGGWVLGSASTYDVIVSQLSSSLGSDEPLRGDLHSLLAMLTEMRKEQLSTAQSQVVPKSNLEPIHSDSEVVPLRHEYVAVSEEIPTPQTTPATRPKPLNLVLLSRGTPR